jgi:hypothetical protein
MATNTTSPQPPAVGLEGLTFQSGWRVSERVKTQPDGTGCANRVLVDHDSAESKRLRPVAGDGAVRFCKRANRPEIQPK